VRALLRFRRLDCGIRLAHGGSERRILVIMPGQIRQCPLAVGTVPASRTMQTAANGSSIMMQARQFALCSLLHLEAIEEYDVSREEQIVEMPGYAAQILTAQSHGAFDRVIAAAQMPARADGRTPRVRRRHRRTRDVIGEVVACCRVSAGAREGDNRVTEQYSALAAHAVSGARPHCHTRRGALPGVETEVLQPHGT